MLLPLCAAAYPVFQDDPGKIARMHCQLLLHSAAGDMPFTMELLDTMMGEPSFSAGAGVSSNADLERVTGGLPDFGFLIGDRWMVTDRETRIRFNSLISQLMVKRGHLKTYSTPEHYTRTCAMKVRVIGAETPDDQSPPEQRAYIAEVSADLAQASPNDKFSVPIVYALRKEPGQAWAITDINFFHTGMVYTYGSSYNTILSLHGFEKLFEILEQELTSPPPTR